MYMKMYVRVFMTLLDRSMISAFVLYGTLEKERKLWKEKCKLLSSINVQNCDH